MQKFIPLGLTILLFTLSSCKKRDADIIIEYVPAWVKPVAPYAEGQSVSFRSGTGQIINATVTISSFIYGAGSVGAFPHNVRPEYITYTLNAGTKQFVVLRLSPLAYVELTVYSPLENYQTAGTFNFSVITGTAQYACAAGGHRCLASVTLNGKTYTDVLEITTPSSIGNFRKAYHTISQGLIGFEYNNGTIFNLE